MPSIELDVATAGVLFICMLAYAAVAKISGPAKAALCIGSAAALVTALFAVPLVGLCVFAASLIFAAADRQLRTRRRT